MKIKCDCENIIVDQTDYLNYKGYIISDTQWLDFWDSIDNAIDQGSSTVDKLELNIKLQDLFRAVWECTKCGNLYFESNNRGLIPFTPNVKGYNAILDKTDTHNIK